MSDLLIEPVHADGGEETTAGNYFISNYPPYSFWTDQDVGQVDATLDIEPDPATPLGLYYHIPFCRKRCHFCYFRVYTDKNAKEIRVYLDATMREFSQLTARPFIQGRKPKFIYFGGGTPSYLSVSQLNELTGEMKRLLPWDEAEEVAFEAEPGTLNPKKLQAIKDIGVTRLSLGIEHFDDHILEINGRAHRSGEVERAYDAARKADFPQINIDLIAGMLEDTEEGWIRAVDKALAMEPDSVTIYQMEVPYNTTIFKQMKAEGKLVAPVADWPTKRGWVNYAFKRFEEAGYTVTSAYTVVKDPAKTKFVYRDLLWQGADLLALGVASFGHLGGTHYQNLTHIDEYVERIQNGESPVKRALFIDKDERMIRELILQMKLGTVDFNYFENKFGQNLRESFGKQVDTLVERDLASLSAGVLTFKRHALLRVDTLLEPFFLPQHRDARYT